MCLRRDLGRGLRQDLAGCLRSFLFLGSLGLVDVDSIGRCPETLEDLFIPDDGLLEGVIEIEVSLCKLVAPCAGCKLLQPHIGGFLDKAAVLQCERLVPGLGLPQLLPGALQLPQDLGVAVVHGLEAVENVVLGLGTEQIDEMSRVLMDIVVFTTDTVDLILPLGTVGQRDICGGDGPSLVVLVLPVRRIGLIIPWVGAVLDWDVRFHGE